MGDDQNSWGYDPANQKLWHNEAEEEGKGERWEVGGWLGGLKCAAGLPFRG